MWKTHLIFCLINSNQENELCNEEVDTKVLVNCISITLKATEETESKDANCQADQGDNNPHPSDDSEE